MIGVEIVPGDAFYYFGKLPGPGGLPVGTSGRVAVLLSGGIDSPVAAWRMMKRGCQATLVHFHSYPFLSRTSQDKARELAALLTQAISCAPGCTSCPSASCSAQITLSVPGPLRVVVYRRMMLRIAERIARARAAQALVTGEVVGQVASQTLENMAVDLGGRDAAGAAAARSAWTRRRSRRRPNASARYPISIVPDEDCCTLFTPRHPATRARLARDRRAAERSLPIDRDGRDRRWRDAVVERFDSRRGSEPRW